MLTLKQIYFKNWCFLLFFLGLGVFSSNILQAQNCNPDIEAPILLGKSPYTLNLDNGVSYNLKAKELVAYAIDDCTPVDQIRISYSQNVSDTVKSLIGSGVNTSQQITVYATDLAGNSSFTKAELKIESCSNNIACHDWVKLTLPAGGVIIPTVDMFLAGNYCKNRSFSLLYKDASGSFQPLILIDNSFPKQFQYMVVDNVNQNKCWGIIELFTSTCDQLNGFDFYCINLSLNCIVDIKPEHLGYPLTSEYSVKENLGSGVFKVNLKGTNCTLNMSYKDSITVSSCAEPNITLLRTWSAERPNGSIASCLQVITIDRKLDTLFQNLADRDYNCKQSYERLSGDIPSPNASGYPVSDICSGQLLGMNYTDQIINVNDPCGVKVKVVREWKILDWCTGQMYLKNQVIRVFCSEDTIRPIPSCITNINIKLDYTYSATLYPSDVDNNSVDNCSKVTLSFDAAGLVKFLNFKLRDTGKVIDIQLWVTDAAGNQDYCNVKVNVIKNVIDPTRKNIVSGVARTYTLTPLNQFGANNRLFISSGGSKYSLENCTAPQGAPFTNYNFCTDTSYNIAKGNLFISRSDDHLNGVTTLDFVMMLKALFGIQPINVYQKIAADVDCDGALTVFDLFDVRKLILGLSNEFKCGSWKFYNTDTISPKEISTIEIDLPKYDFDFVPIKIGDLNLSSKYQDEVIEVRNGSEFKFTVDDFEMEKGNTYYVWLRAEQLYSIYALQIGQIFDPSKVEILELSSPVQGIQKDVDYVINPRDWRGLLMDATANKFSIEGGFLKIKVEALADGRVSSALFNDPSPFPILVIDENITLAETKIVSRTVTSNKEANTYNWSVQVAPNPFSESLNLLINSPSNEDVNIKVSSIEGKQIYNRIFKMNEGVNEVSLDETLFPNQGVYFINVESQSMKTVKRVIKN
jgi:hypothetical protein